MKRYLVPVITVLVSVCLSLAIVFACFIYTKDTLVNPVGLTDLADLAEKVRPAVVRVLVKRVEVPSDVPDLPVPKQAPKHKQRSSGSGFIISSDGYVVTNVHVIRDALEIVVVLLDGAEFDAKLVGHDPMTDLAVLKINSEKELPFVRFGNSDTARVGDLIIVIGSPLDFVDTMSWGIISALGRKLSNSSFVGFIQTDAAINKGNSGGPMFNIFGKVIGIVSGHFSLTGVNIGIGFAIPSSIAQSVVEQLIQHGEVRRGWLGVHLQTITLGIAKAFGFNKEAFSVIVTHVIEGGPAHKAGIKMGDIILFVGEKKISEKRMLVHMIANIQPNSKVVVTVWRESEEKKVFVTIGKVEDDSSEKEEDSQVVKGQKIPQLGVTLSLVTPLLREVYNINEQGVVVIAVEKGSPAEQKGVKFGDIISKIQNQSVTDVVDVLRVLDELRTAGRTDVLLYVESEFGPRFVAIEMKK
ncbi:hypothetical protein CL630_03175 [bacterium]|nr:hypothetical protein [bacterium]|tara:strand:- start:53 stop:1456 length:1404 start_codon:yes stop_codon:yes gene_type:complete